MRAKNTKFGPLCPPPVTPTNSNSNTIRELHMPMDIQFHIDIEYR